MPIDARWRWALRVATALSVAPLFLSRHLPLCDLPEHLAVVATLRHWFDPAYAGPENFTLAPMLREQYVLYHLVAAALAFPFGGAERANLFLLACTAVGFPYALRELLRALRGDERLAVLGCALFWNKALAEGLVNYVASIPVAVWGLALAVRQAEQPTRRRWVGLAALTLALFYLHLSSFVLFVVGAVTLALLVPAPDGALRAVASRVRGLPRAIAWLSPAAIVATIFAVTSSVTHPDASQGAHAGLVRFAPKRRLLASLAEWMHDVWKTPAEDVLAFAAWVALAIVVVRAAPGATREERWGRAVGGVLLALAFAFFFFMPAQVGFAFLLDVRMAPFVGLFATLVAPRTDDPRATRAIAALTAAVAALAVSGAWQMREYEREEAAHFDSVLRGLPPGKRLLTLTFDQRSERAAVAPFIHFGAYYRVRYGGVASFSFAELPHWPVQYRPDRAPPKKRIVFWDWNPCLFRNAKDGPYYDFVLVRGEIDPFAKSPPGPAWRMAGGSKDWRLWQRVEGTWNEGDAESDPGPCKTVE